LEGKLTAKICCRARRRLDGSQQRIIYAGLGFEIEGAIIFIVSDLWPSNGLNNLGVKAAQTAMLNAFSNI